MWTEDAQLLLIRVTGSADDVFVSVVFLEAKTFQDFLFFFPHFVRGVLS